MTLNKYVFSFFFDKFYWSDDLQTLRKTGYVCDKVNDTTLDRHPGYEYRPSFETIPGGTKRVLRPQVPSEL